MNGFEILKDVNKDIRDAISEYGIVVDTGMIGYADDIRQIKKVDPQLSFPKNTKFAYSKFSFFPEIDISEWDDCSYMFAYCENLRSVPTELNTSNVTNFYGMFQNCSWYDDDFNFYSLETIGTIDCSNATDVSYIFYNTYIKKLSGLINLGKRRDVYGTKTMYVYDLTKDSIVNLFNGLYDRASAGYSELTIRLKTQQIEQLSDYEMNIAINKGWIIEVSD